MKNFRFYMAGPDVFLDDELRRFVVDSKKRILKTLGLEGIDPLDNSLDIKNMLPKEAGLAIYRSNIGLIQSCDAAIFNLTPFRGVSADAGTVFELGFAAATGKPMSAYTLSNRNYSERIPRHDVHKRYDGNLHEIEEFSMVDNLMIESALIDKGFKVIKAGIPSPPGELFEVGVFTEAAEALSEAIRKHYG